MCPKNSLLARIFSSCTLSPTDNLGKTGCTPKKILGNFRYEFLIHKFIVQTYKRRPIFSVEPFWWFCHVVFLVILQIGTCKNVATKHTINQNTEIFGFLGSKYQIITQLGHQDKNRPYKVSKNLFKLFFCENTRKTTGNKVQLNH